VQPNGRATRARASNFAMQPDARREKGFKKCTRTIKMSNLLPLTKINHLAVLPGKRQAHVEGKPSHLNTQGGIAQHVGRACFATCFGRAPSLPTSPSFISIRLLFLSASSIACVSTFDRSWCCLYMCTAKKHHVFSVRPSKSAAPRAYA
jgi:hypothetical protein